MFLVDLATLGHFPMRLKCRGYVWEFHLVCIMLIERVQQDLCVGGGDRYNNKRECRRLPTKCFMTNSTLF